MNLPHSLSRSLVIRAPRSVVFRFFTDSERFARWWGKGSTIAAEVGGEVKIVYPNEVVVLGEVTAIEPDTSIAFTYGYESTQPELPAGGSLVTIELFDDPGGTRLELRHDLPTENMRDQHRPGWRFALSQFANAVCSEHHAEVGARVDQWFEAWAETDPAARAELLKACATDDVTMQDAFSCVRGRDELDEHIAITHMHMPGVVGKRASEPKQCQGTALVEWVATDSAGNPKGKGTNVVRLAADGRIAAVVGFW